MILRNDNIALGRGIRNEVVSSRNHLGESKLQGLIRWFSDTKGDVNLKIVL